MFAIDVEHVDDLDPYDVVELDDDFDVDVDQHPDVDDGYDHHHADEHCNLHDELG